MIDLRHRAGLRHVQSRYRSVNVLKSERLGVRQVWAKRFWKHGTHREGRLVLPVGRGIILDDAIAVTDHFAVADLIAS